MAEKILNALKGLDPKNDDSWTADGQPRLEAVKSAVGDQTITREQVVAASPGFNRKSAAEAPPAAPIAGVAGTGAGATSAAPSAPPAPVAPIAPGVPPFAAATVAGTPDEVADAKSAMEQAQSKLRDIDGWIEGAIKERAKRAAIADAAQVAHDRLVPPETTRDAIMGYLNQQKKTLAARGAAFARAAAFKAEHGFNITDLLPQRAKVDAVRGRKLGYGNARPAPQVPVTAPPTSGTK